MKLSSFEANEYMFLKDIVDMPFLYDASEPITKIIMDSQWGAKKNYIIKVLFCGHRRKLCLSNRSLSDLLLITSGSISTIMTVKYVGTWGEGKGIHYKFSIVDCAQDKQELGISNFM